MARIYAQSVVVAIVGTIIVAAILVATRGHAPPAPTWGWARYAVSNDARDAAFARAMQKHHDCQVLVANALDAEWRSENAVAHGDYPGAQRILKTAHRLVRQAETCHAGFVRM